VFRFDDLAPEAKRAAFAHMDKIKGKGSFSGKLSDGKKAKPRGKTTLGSGARHAKLSSQRKNQSLPDARAAKAAPAGPLSTEDSIGAAYKSLSSKPNRFVKLTELRPLIGGKDREDVDKTLIAMFRSGDVHLSPDSDRRNLTDADRAAAIRVGNEDKHLIAFSELPDVPAAKPSSDPKKLAASRTPEDHAELAQRYLQMHGDAGVQKRIKQLSARKRLGPGERAQLAALKSLGKK